MTKISNHDHIVLDVDEDGGLGIMFSLFYCERHRMLTYLISVCIFKLQLKFNWYIITGSCLFPEYGFEILIKMWLCSS